MEVLNSLFILKEKATISDSLLCFCDPAGTRTQDPNIKSVVLYQLSYEIIPKNVDKLWKTASLYFFSRCKNKPKTYPTKLLPKIQ